MASSFATLTLLFLLFLQQYSLVSRTDAIEIDENAPLSADELRKLRDFVRKRGHGSIARLALHGGDPLMLPEPELGPEQPEPPDPGGQQQLAELGTPPFKPFEVIMPPGMRGPASTTMATNGKMEAQPRNNVTPNKKGVGPPEHEDYEKLANLLQRFLRNRQRSAAEGETTTDGPLIILGKKPNQKKKNVENEEEVDQQQQDKKERKSMEMLAMDEDEAEERKSTSPLASSKIEEEGDRRQIMAKGKLLGTVPVAVEIGDDQQQQQRGEEGKKMKSKDHRHHHPADQGEEEEDDVAIKSSLDGRDHHHGKGMANKVDDRHLLEKVTMMDVDDADESALSPNVSSSSSKLGHNSWTGSVEKVVTVSNTKPQHVQHEHGHHEHHPTRINGAGTVRSISPSAVIRPQILGRVLIQPSKGNHQQQQDERFFYQLSNGGQETETTTTRTKTNPSTNSNKKAQITILREGFARQHRSEYMFVASITLIRDAGKVILVDTGMGTDINGRTDLIKKLGELGIAPPAIDYVITTHGHPDHAGNTNDFPDAVHFQGAMAHHRTKFNFTELFEAERHQLTDNVALLRTPGHTSEDISVVVQNADQYGTVVVAGDVFIAAEDLERPLMWRPQAWNETAQEHSRRRLVCDTGADFVVPGHGRMFRVDAEARRRVGCADRPDQGDQ